MRPASELAEAFRAIRRQAGLPYALVYAARWLLRCASDMVEGILLAIERRKGLVAPWAVSSRRFTIAENRVWWTRHDWSSLGEEWTPDLEWKRAIVSRYLVPYVPEGGAVVEIGPGGGRWTEYLVARSQRLLLIDISDGILDLCRARFAGNSNITYVLTDAPKIQAPSVSVDAIWTYDVFVHINPTDAREYIYEFGRVLKSGCYAVVHHPGDAPSGGRARPNQRSELTPEMVCNFAAEAGLEVAEQTNELVNVGDVLTVLRKR